MKLPAFVLAFAALAGTGDAFVNQETSKRVTAMFQSVGTTIGPVTGGVGGSTLLPGKYGKVDIDNPWGTGSTRPFNRPEGRLPEPDNSIFFGGPVTGGVAGSSLTPREYERVEVDNPWGGKNPAHPNFLYYPKAGPGFGGQARLPQTRRPMIIAQGSSHGAVLPALKGSTGGVDGSTMLPTGYGKVNIDNPWGDSRQVLTNINAAPIAPPALPKPEPPMAESPPPPPAILEPEPPAPPMAEAPPAPEPAGAAQ